MKKLFLALALLTVPCWGQGAPPTTLLPGTVGNTGGLAILGGYSVTTSGSTYTLAPNEWWHQGLNIAGTATAIVAPKNIGQAYDVTNSESGSITFGGSTGTVVTIAAGTTVRVKCSDGANYVQVGSSGGGGLPSGTGLVGVTSGTGRLGLATDIASLLTPLSGCGTTGNVYSPPNAGCVPSLSSVVPIQTVLAGPPSGSPGVPSFSATPTIQSLTTINGIAAGAPVTAPSFVSGTPSSGALAALPTGAHGDSCDESSTVGVPAAGVDYRRCDSVTHSYVCSYNGASEVPCPGTSGGSGLPTATAPGQIPASTAAGTTYAVQGEIFYNQTGDTISSIETECSSLCTYVVTVPQTITIAGNHTLNANVQLAFQAGGKWTVNGAFTLTIPGNVSGTLNTHFAGTSAILFGQSQMLVPVEWFGAVGDWNGTSGTDNAAAINAALNSLTIGQIQLQALTYRVNSAVTVSKNRIGIAGVAEGSFANNTQISAIINTCASCDTLDIAGTNVASVGGGVFSHFMLQRSVTPTGSATGFHATFSGEVCQNVNSIDSIRDFYVHAGALQMYQCGFADGFNGVAMPTSGNISGIEIDSDDGLNSQSMNIFNTGGGFNNAGCTNTATKRSIYAHGTAINDFETWMFTSSLPDYGIDEEYTGSGAPDSDADIHYWDSVIDGSCIAGIKINGLVPGGFGSVEMSGGYVVSANTNAQAIDIENSQGVTVTSMEVSAVLLDGSNLAAIVAHNSSNLVFTALNNPYVGFAGNTTAYGIIFNGVTNSTIANNTFQVGTSATPASAINMISSPGNNVTGNSFGGTFSASPIAMDASSLNSNFMANGPLQNNVLGGTAPGGFGFSIVNSTNTTSSYAQNTACIIDVSHCVGLYALGNFTPGGMHFANSGYFSSSSGLAGGIAINTEDSGAPVRMGTSNTLGMTMDGADQHTTWTAPMTVTNLTDSALTPGNLVCAGTGGLLATSGCPSNIFITSKTWSIQGVLFATSTLLGAVYDAPFGGGEGNLVVRLSGTISCTVAPTVQIMDMGTNPVTATYGGSTAIDTLTTGTSDGVYKTSTGGGAVVAGHYYGVAFSAGTCVTAPTFDITTLW
jgi:hypothetical protein